MSFVVDGVAQVPNEITGWSIAETTGSAGAKVRFHDGTSSAAPELGALVELASGTDQNYSSSTGIEVASGAVWLEVVSGSVDVELYW